MERTGTFHGLGRRGTGFGTRVVGVAAVVVALISASATAAAEDGEYRGQVTVAKALGSVRLTVGVEARSTSSIPDVHYRAAAVGVERSVGERVVVAADYARVETKRQTGWEVEQRPYGDVTLKWKAVGLSLSDRNRVELRIRDEKGSLRYRNRLRAVRNLGSSGLRVRVDNEVFVVVEGPEMSKNRVTVGMDVRTTATTRAGVFYIFESRRKSDDWGHVHGLGVQVSCSL